MEVHIIFHWCIFLCYVSLKKWANIYRDQIVFLLNDIKCSTNYCFQKHIRAREFCSRSDACRILSILTATFQDFLKATMLKHQASGTGSKLIARGHYIPFPRPIEQADNSKKNNKPYKVLGAGLFCNVSKKSRDFRFCWLVVSWDDAMLYTTRVLSHMLLFVFCRICEARNRNA